MSRSFKILDKDGIDMTSETVAKYKGVKEFAQFLDLAANKQGSWASGWDNVRNDIFKFYLDDVYNKTIEERNEHFKSTESFLTPLYVAINEMEHNELVFKVKYRVVYKLDGEYKELDGFFRSRGTIYKELEDFTKWDSIISSEVR